MIYAGGISISPKEIEYVNDALVNGWDANHDKYLKAFEERFASYIGVRYAKAVSGGTQALLLALATLGIKPGDEVILPDLTYFACSDVIMERGATPVFVDVDPRTWCIDTELLEAAITPRTKAIMPVWKYGNAPEMGEVMRIAEKYNLKVIEDACPAVGSTWGGFKAGSFGDFGCFSFHGSKIMTTGFGGMIVTNDPNLYDELLWINNHGERGVPRFWQTRTGYSFDMSNMSAAMGLAQLERIDDFVNAKRTIFKWYKDRLGDIEGLELNYETALTYSNMWMTSIVLNNTSFIPRDRLMRELKSRFIRQIDTRPFFNPISDFPMYNRADTPNAHFLGSQGINLPSGVQRTENDIDYICDCIKEVLFNAR